MHEVLARKTLARIDLDLLERAIVVERNGCVEQQVRVADGVHATMRQERADVLVQLLADAERVVQLAYQVGLLRGELIWVGRVDGGEVAALHLVGLAIDGAQMLIVVHGAEHAAIQHLPLGVALEDGSLGLELQHCNGLVHLGGELLRLIVHGVARQQLGHELQTGIVAIHIERKGGQRHQVDAILLDGGEVGIAQAEAQHIADAGVVASRGTHPQHIVIAPLDVPRVVLAQGVHDDVGTRATIVDVAQYVQLVDGQALDDVTDGADEIISTTRRYDGVDNHADVGSLVVVAQTLVQQLFDDIGKIVRQRLAHLRTGVLAADIATHLYQLVDGDAIPIVDILLLGLDELQLLLRIVDEGAQLLLLALADVVAKEFIDFSFDIT